MRSTYEIFLVEKFFTQIAIALIDFGIVLQIITYPIASINYKLICVQVQTSLQNLSILRFLELIQILLVTV